MPKRKPLTKISGYAVESLESLESRRLLSFSPAVNYSVGVGAWGMQVGDFNGDHIPDLATADFLSNDIAALLGNGNGTFQPARYSYVTTGTYPETLAIGDFNRDGKLDVATGNDAAAEVPGNNGISVLLGNGDGTFTPTDSPEWFEWTSAIATGDFNGDGKLDLVTTSVDASGFSYVSMLLGGGDGTFTPSGAGASAEDFTSLAPADFNGDGKLDLAVTGAASTAVFMGNGNGTFSAPSGIGVDASSLAAADFNRDGKLDLATPSGSTSVSIRRGNGDGTFQAAQSFATGTAPWSIQAADVDGDGALDLGVLTSQPGGSSGLTVLLGDGNGSLTSPITTAAGSDRISLVMADLNGDGRPDAAVSDFYNRVSIRINDGNWHSRTYVGPTDGSWSTAGNWSPSGVPTASDQVTISGKSVNLSASATVASLTLTGGASLSVAADGSRVLRTSSSSISSDSTLNLNDNALIVDYSGASPLTQVRDLIIAGRNGGAWNGFGITSSAAAAAPETALGYAEATDVFAGFPANFRGQSVDATSILVRQTLLGDANLDGDVDVTDLGILATNWQSDGQTFSSGDFNYDGIVEVSDLGILATNWQQSLPPVGGSRQSKVRKAIPFARALSLVGLESARLLALPVAAMMSTAEIS